MRLLWAVAVDLGMFAYDAIRALFGFAAAAPRQISQLALPASSFTQIPARTAPHELSTHLEPHEIEARVFSEIQKNTIMYTSSIRTPLLRAPGAEGDAVVATLPYGSMVMVLESKSPYARIVSGATEGWIYIDDLTDRAANVYPQFTIGEENFAEDVNTERVRAIIDDEFGAGDMAMPLQAEEYVLYRVARKGMHIPWPPVRPRSPGLWHQILKDAAGISVSGEPAPSAIMELHFGDDMSPKGHLAYVEAVFPDNSVQVSEANWPEDGIYNERILVEEEWQALKPQFIKLT